jgi:hypothetical protein
MPTALEQPPVTARRGWWALAASGSLALLCGYFVLVLVPSRAGPASIGAFLGVWWVVRWWTVRRNWLEAWLTNMTATSLSTLFSILVLDTSYAVYLNLAEPSQASLDDPQYYMETVSDKLGRRDQSAAVLPDGKELFPP